VKNVDLPAMLKDNVFDIAYNYTSILLIATYSLPYQLAIIYNI
jgi:hypothetical protein